MVQNNFGKASYIQSVGHYYIYIHIYIIVHKKCFSTETSSPVQISTRATLNAEIPSAA